MYACRLYTNVYIYLCIHVGTNVDSQILRREDSRTETHEDAWKQCHGVAARYMHIFR